MDSENTIADIPFIEKFQLYYIPILVHVGILGNCLSVCIFFGTKLQYLSSSIYLGALAISDIGFLITVFATWLDLLHVHFFNEPGFCQFFVYLGYLSSFLSVWLVVAFTIERYIAVKYPLRRQFLCTVARAKMTVMGLTALGITVCSPMLLFAQSVKSSIDGNRTSCQLDRNWMFWASIYNSIDAVLTFAVPMVLIIIFNTLIARNIYKLNRIRRTLTIESDVRNERDTNVHSRRDTTQQTKVTKMLLFVSSTFFCLHMPSCVLRMLASFYKGDFGGPSSADLIQQISNTLFDTSFGINFFLYCASGDNFRREIVRLFKNRSSRSRSLTSNYGNQYGIELAHKWSSKKYLHSANAAQPKDSREKEKLSISEEEKM